MAENRQNGVAERLKAVADALEEIVADRSLLTELTVEERTRLLALAGDVHNPDVLARRRFAETSGTSEARVAHTSGPARIRTENQGIMSPLL